MNEKIYFNEIKKKFAYINYFQSCIIIFLKKSPRTSIHFRQRCTSFRNPSTSCFVTQICLLQFFIFEPPYPASYCTHINTLITINGLHSSVNFNWRNFSAVKNLITARCLNRTSENSSILMCTGENCKHLCAKGEV